MKKATPVALHRPCSRALALAGAFAAALAGCDGWRAAPAAGASDSAPGPGATTAGTGQAAPLPGLAASPRYYELLRRAGARGSVRERMQVIAARAGSGGGGGPAAGRAPSVGSPAWALPGSELRERLAQHDRLLDRARAITDHTRRAKRLRAARSALDALRPRVQPEHPHPALLAAWLALQVSRSPGGPVLCEPSPGTTEPVPEIPEDGTRVVDGRGGLVQAPVSSPVAGATVQIPEGALDAAVAIGIHDSSVPLPAAGGARAFGPAVELTPDGQTFRTAVGIALPYDRAALAEAGVSASALRVLYFNPERAAWEEVPGSYVDDVAGLVWAPTMHFSHYVAGLPPAPPSIGAVSPAAAIAGTVLTISGSNFELSAAANHVSIDGAAATVVEVDAEEGSWLKVRVPAGIASGPVTLTVETDTFLGQPASADFNHLASRAYVLNAITNDVSVIDLVRKTEMARVSVGVDPLIGFPHDIAVRSDGSEIYVVNLGESLVKVISAVTLSELASIDLSSGGMPAFLALSPDETLLAVGLDESIALVDVAPGSATRFQELTRTALTSGVLRFAFTDDGARLYAPTAGTQKFYGIDADPASPSFGSTLFAPLALPTGFSYDVVIQGQIAFVADQNQTISRINVNADDGAGYHQLMQPLPTNGRVAFLARDDARGQVLAVWNGTNGEGRVRQITSAGIWSESDATTMPYIERQRLHGPSGKLYALHNDYDPSTADSISVVDLGSLQVVGTLASAGNSPYDLGVHDGLGLHVIANGENDNVRLLGSDGEVSGDLSIAGVPWIVAIAPER